jgi:hypothetical protein
MIEKRGEIRDELHTEWDAPIRPDDGVGAPGGCDRNLQHLHSRGGFEGYRRADSERK